MKHIRPFSSFGFALLLAACAQPNQPPVQPLFPQRSMTAQQHPAPPPSARPPAYPQTRDTAAAPQYPSAPYSAPVPHTPLWRTISAPRSEALAAGGAMRHMLRVGDGGSSVSLDVVTFDESRCTLRVVDQPNASAGGRIISPIMNAHLAIAGVNGGFFTPEFQPLGLQISGGHRSGALSNTKLLSGMALVAGGRPHLVWRAEFRGEVGVTDLIQTGPRLVDAGTPIAGLDRKASRVRTFILTNGSGTWALGIARSASLGALADLLASPGIIPGVRVNRALNLDGGNSSALWLRTASGQEVSDPGWSTVRNYLAVIPK